MMESEETKFTKIKARIKSDKQNRDIPKVCNRVGVSTQIYWSAMKRNTIDELTGDELLVIRGFLRLLDERKEALEEVKASC